VDWPDCWIDAHTHVFSDDPLILDLLTGVNLKLLTVCLSQGSVAETSRQHAVVGDLVSRHPQHFALCGTFPWHDFASPDYPDQARAALDDACRRGAVAIKVWKDIGMECRDSAGQWVQVDHPAFAPVWEHLIRLDLTLTAHLGEPLAAWLPLDPASPHYLYYTEYPQWHWYNRDDVPSHATIIAARERLMTRYPRLRVVGCHLASLEWDVAVLARSLDRFPQLAVDTAARMADLMIQDRETVRDFFIRYQDRILYGTDMAWQFAVEPVPLPLEECLLRAQDLWQRDLTWLATDESVTWRDRTFPGLALPEKVVRKVIYENACRWYPGIE